MSVNEGDEKRNRAELDFAAIHHLYKAEKERERERERERETERERERKR